MRYLIERVKIQLSKIHSKIVLYYVGFMVIPMCLMLFIFNVTIEGMKHSEVEYMMNTMSQMSESMSQTIYVITNKVGQLSIDEDFVGLLERKGVDGAVWTRERIEELIIKYVGDVAYLENAYVLAYDGHVYALNKGRSSLPEEYSFVKTDWYSKMQTFHYSSMLLTTQNMKDYMAENEAVNVITYIKEVRDDSGILGYIMLEIEATVFDAYINSLYFREGSNIAVVDSDIKRIIYHTDAAQISSQYHASYLGKVFGNETGCFIADSTQEQEIVTYIYSPETKWTIIYTIPTKIAYKAIYSLTNLLKYILLFWIPIAIVLSILISSGLTKPIFMLRDSMGKVEKGEFDVFVNIDSRDEIGDLSRGFNKMIGQIKRLIDEVYQKELHRKEAELGALQMQINPHFLYNTLQIMDVMAEEKEVYEISDTCQSLATIFRYSVRKREEVALKEELEHVNNYMQIQKLRFGKRLETEYHIDAKTLSLEAIKLIIQPIVENAIIHGMEHREGVCKIIISAELKDSRLIITVEDTGAGMTQEELRKVREEVNREATQQDVTKKVYGGIAMRNVHQRIRLKYGECFGIEISSEKKVGTKVKIILPVKKFGRE